MTDPSAASLADARHGVWSGTADFRLMPTDDFAGDASTLTITDAAAGRATLLSYTWTHPTDGPQSGTVMLGVPSDEGDVSAAWVDSWHQRDLVLLTGRAGSRSVSVGYEYAPGWQWEIEVVAADQLVTMIMHNLVPGREAEPAVRYDVMRATWS